MNIVKVNLLVLLFLLKVSFLFALNPDSLSGLLRDIDGHRDKVVEMNLRLKNYDRVFGQLVFYDSDNIDIVFDISRDEIKGLLKEDLLNVHEGMLYRVRMQVKGKGSLGGIIAEIINFKPLIFQIIP